jgi:hypothetical protein
VPLGVVSTIAAVVAAGTAAVAVRVVVALGAAVGGEGAPEQAVRSTSKQQSSARLIDRPSMSLMEMCLNRSTPGLHNTMPVW